jgi:hypothetical protein
MPSLILGRFFLPFAFVVDVFLMISVLPAADHEVNESRTGVCCYPALDQVMGSRLIGHLNRNTSAKHRPTRSYQFAAMGQIGPLPRCSFLFAHRGAFILQVASA